MTIRGTVKDASGAVKVTVKVNDRSYYLTVNRDGSFSKQITFTTSKTYVITVKATDLSGNTATVTRNVIYSLDNHDDDDHHDD
jgi:uncharacterized beta-barrel protein YwiB (DUF1934 family)